MAITIKGLRVGLVVALLALVAVIAGYIAHARLKLPNFKDIAAKNGLDITSEGVTFSPTIGSNTVLTLHAARQVQRNDGKIMLHDVGIVVYGKKSDRSDRIHGAEFEYDPKAQVLTAVGEVFIDLQAPAMASDRGKLQNGAQKGRGDAALAKVEDEGRVVHVKTSGLVFEEKERSASTDAPVEFVAAGMTGKSVGASYDSEAGVLVLKSAVSLSGLKKDRPVVVTAARAEMNRASEGETGSVVKLEGAKAILSTERGARVATGDHAVVRVAADGTPERVDATGHVTLTGDRVGVLMGNRLAMELNANGQPKTGVMSGDVHFAELTAARVQEDGDAREVRVAFDGEGRPVHATFLGDVKMHEKLVIGSERRLDAAKVEMDLGGGGKAPTILRGAVASGESGAKLRLVDVKKDGATEVAAVRADVLTGRFGQVAAVAGKKGLASSLLGLDGVGRTVLDQVVTEVSGVVDSKETSTGDVLTMDFRTGVDGKTEVVRAEQHGSVNVVREVKAKEPAKKVAVAGKVDGPAGSAKATAPEVEHAKADVAVYDKAANKLTMTGGVQLQDAESALFAERVEADRASGVSTADGGVKVSYLQAGSTGEPVHVLAGRAVSHKTTGVTEFSAAAGGRAKMWQGGSQVEAPLLDFDRTRKTLVAHDVAGSNVAAVRTVIVDGGRDTGKATAAAGSAMTAKAAGKRQGKGGPMRVSSEQVIYTDAARQIEFKGWVKVEDGDGVMRAQDAVVYLAAAAAGASKEAPVALGGKVDHMVATGAIEMEQPGRRGTGEKLTYAASDETFVLTGTKAAAPKVVDEMKGTVTGAALRFKTGDDSVVVLGEDGGKVRSETRMKQ